MRLPPLCPTIIRYGSFIAFNIEWGLKVANRAAIGCESHA
jgi:hypothetical protein